MGQRFEFDIKYTADDFLQYIVSNGRRNKAPLWISRIGLLSLPAIPIVSYFLFQDEFEFAGFVNGFTLACLVWIAMHVVTIRCMRPGTTGLYSQPTRIVVDEQQVSTSSPGAQCH